MEELVQLQKESYHFLEITLDWNDLILGKDI